MYHRELKEKEFKEMTSTKNLKMVKLSFDVLVVQTASNQITILDHYMLSLGINLHGGTNDILTNANHEETARNITKIGLNCRNYGVNDVVISSILVQKNPNLNTLIRRANNLLRDLGSMSDFGYICNDAITTKYLWKDGIHLQDLGTNILSSNFIKFVNSFSVDNDNNRF